MCCCYECKERKVGCHSECEAYKKYVKENEKRKEKIKEENAKRDIFWTGSVKYRYTF